MMMMMMRYLCVRRRTSLNSWAPTPFDQACMPLLFLWQEMYRAILTNSMLQVREIRIKILTNPFTMFACPNCSCMQNLYISWAKIAIKYVFKLQNCLGLYCIFFAKSALTSFCTIWGGFQVSPFGARHLEQIMVNINCELFHERWLHFWDLSNPATISALQLPSLSNWG